MYCKVYAVTPGIKERQLFHSIIMSVKLEEVKTMAKDYRFCFKIGQAI